MIERRRLKIASVGWELRARVPKVGVAQMIPRHRTGMGKACQQRVKDDRRKPLISCSIYILRLNVGSAAPGIKRCPSG